MQLRLENVFQLHCGSDVGGGQVVWLCLTGEACHALRPDFWLIQPADIAVGCHIQRPMAVYQNWHSARWLVLGSGYSPKHV
jgi:hypothetical protein